MRPTTRAERDKDPTSPGVFVGVVECKKAGAVLADHVRDQALRYADAVRATFVGVTNGQDFDTWAWEQKEKDYVPKQRFPTYRQMLQGESLPDEPEEDPFVRPTWVQLNNAAFLRQALEKYSEEFVCDKALDWIKRHAFDLYNLFRSSASVPDLPWTGYGGRVLEDWGSNFKEFGNASGGSYPGYYRTFLVDEGGGTAHTLIHLGLSSVLSQRRDEKLKRETVKTYLLVAVSDEERHHNSLQLWVEKFWRQRGDFIEVTHEGALAFGKGGSVSRNTTLKVVTTKAPMVLQDGQVFLGRFSTSKQIVWSDARDMILRLARYALLRDKVRQRARGASSR